MDCMAVHCQDYWQNASNLHAERTRLVASLQQVQRPLRHVLCVHQLPTVYPGAWHGRTLGAVHSLLATFVSGLRWQGHCRRLGQ